MKACPAWIDALLEADPAELRAGGGTPLARHLRSCPGCARAARIILEETERLHAALDAEVPPAEAALATALRAAPRRRAAAAAAVLTLLAAGVAGLLLLPGTPPGGAAPLPRHRPPLVESTGGRDVAVLATSDSLVTVLWFF